MKRTLILLSVASLLVGTAVYSASPKGKKPGQNQDSITRCKQPTPKVDIVIALDTSGSMSGLINAARQKLWDIVNEVAKAQPAPRLRVGLMTYGSQGSEEDGYVVVRSDLTTDLDTIYSKLFELRTSGGTEYVGRVVYRSVKELSWDKDPDTLRQIYVAGNESADQDRTVTAAQAVRAARKDDIFVNAIYCGNTSNSDAPGWAAVAHKGSGMYASIDHNHGTVTIATPYDGQLNKLSAKLNATYVAYGLRGGEAKARQSAQDSNASSMHSSVAAARAVAKASGVYRNEGWDLVDARKAGKLKKISKKALPAPLQEMDREELNTYITKKATERKQLKKQILELSKKRKDYIAAEMKKKGKSGNKAFDTAIKRALREQAAKKKIVLK
jgi:hypothetical protein